MKSHKENAAGPVKAEEKIFRKRGVRFTDMAKRGYGRSAFLVESEGKIGCRASDQFPADPKGGLAVRR